MPRWQDSLKSLPIWGLGAIAGVCLCAAGVRAALPAASQATMPRPPASRQLAASRPVVASQPIFEDFQAYYQDRLAEIKASDVDGLYSLALLCLRKERPDLAGDLCRKILANWPAHARSKSLLRVSNLRQVAASRPASSRPAMTQPVFTPAGVLSPEAIHLIRLNEFRVEDMTDRPRVSISKRVIQEFLDEAAKSQAMTDGDRKLFHEGANDDKLRWMLKVAGDRYLDRVEMTSEPRNMAAFRQRIWPIISRGCGAPACHGGEKAGGLRYVLPVSYGPAMSTNFYIASRFEAAEGKLVDREHAEASLLLQFGLSGEQAEWKHPVAITPVFPSPSDPKYRIVLDWIRQLRSPAPDYGITDRMWKSLPGRPGAPKAE